jgi:hypothetical protein
VPWILGIGGSYDLARVRRSAVSLALSTTYEHGSSYIDRQSVRPLPGYAFKDVWTGTAGLRVARDDRPGFLFHVTYHRTPIPPQTGRTHYVDNDRFGFILGTLRTALLYGGALARRGQPGTIRRGPVEAGVIRPAQR